MSSNEDFKRQIGAWRVVAETQISNMTIGEKRKTLAHLVSYIRETDSEEMARRMYPAEHPLIQALDGTLELSEVS